MTLPKIFFPVFLGASLFCAQAQPVAPVPAAPSPAAQDDSVNIQFPRTSILDILPLYESLTGKKIIRDSNLAGPELSIMVSRPVPRSEAVKIIESSLLLNGYTLVPVDGDTVKILGPSNSPRKEGVPIYTEVSQLENIGDQVISFFAPLRFIAPQEAAAVVTGVVQVNAYGSIIPAPSANALIITDKTPVVAKALSVLGLIDREPAMVVTRFIQLQRANVETVVETLDEMFGTEDSSTTGGATAPVPVPGNPEGGGAAPAASVGGTAQYEDRLLLGKSRFIADKRTNRVLVITRNENFRYLSEVIAQLDAAGSFEQPLVKTLNYMSVNDAFPVLTTMLAEKGEETNTQGGAPGTNPANPINNTGRNQDGFGSGFGNSNSTGGGLNRPDRLSDEALQSPPLSASLGNIRIIADTSANSIIVYGPPDSKERAKQIIELLDRRPRQVYLAAVIGQLRMGKNLDYGVSYLVRYQNFTPIRNLLDGGDQTGGAASVLSPRIFPGFDVLPDPSSLVSPDTFAQLSGLTIYGSIAESVDVFARFLETTNRFTTLARPVVYTTNNKKATILSGRREPVPTSTLTSTTPGLGDNNSITSNIQYEDVVLKLEVIPLINSDNEVNLVIAQTNDEVTGSQLISGNEVPVISTQEITTSVRVKSGSTIVLGGLIRNTDEKRTDGIPYLNQIPVVGPIFGGSSFTDDSKDELIVLIQPIVVDSEEDAYLASQREGMRTPLGTEAQALAAQPAQFFNEAAPTPFPTPKPKSKFRFPWSKPKQEN